MLLYYPRYKKLDYEALLESYLYCLLHEYGLPVAGDVDDKMRFAMGVFLSATTSTDGGCSYTLVVTRIRGLSRSTSHALPW
jgi:hypothetical protein